MAYRRMCKCFPIERLGTIENAPEMGKARTTRPGFALFLSNTALTSGVAFLIRPDGRPNLLTRW
jgi:hypothetical protein